MMMMMYKHLSIVLALSFLAGKVVAQAFTEDYTLASPAYKATVSNGVMTFTGNYTILADHSPSDYTQTFTSLDNPVTGVCPGTATTTPPTTPSVTIFTAEQTGTKRMVSTSFTVTLASPVYTTTVNGGTIALCHRIELTKNDLLVNVVDTKVTATVDLTANFVAVGITTTAPDTYDGATGQVNLASTVTASADKTTVKAGQPIKITVTSTSYEIESITAKFSDALTVIPNDANAPLLASTPDCLTDPKKCVFDLNLGIAFFNSAIAGADGAGGYTLTGTAKLKLGRRRHLQEQKQEQEDAPFTLTFYEAPDDAASSAVGVVGGSTPMMFTMTFAAAGGLVAALAVV
jgi:hypothetical protein